MRKIFCDICGKEIEKPDITINLDLINWEEDTEEIISQFDVCENCTREAIEKLKKFNLK